MIDELDNLIGADISKAHLSWFHLSRSSIKLKPNNLYWPNMREPDLRGNIIGAPEDFVEIMMQCLQSSKSAIRPLKERELAEQLYHQGKLLNLATQRELTQEEKTERGTTRSGFCWWQVDV